MGYESVVANGMEPQIGVTGVVEVTPQVPKGRGVYNGGCGRSGSPNVLLPADQNIVACSVLLLSGQPKLGLFLPEDLPGVLQNKSAPGNGFPGEQAQTLALVAAGPPDLQTPEWTPLDHAIPAVGRAGATRTALVDRPDRIHRPSL